MAILSAAPLKYRSGAVFYPFRQESNFLYLTGFLEPEALAVIQRVGDSGSGSRNRDTPAESDYIFHLFVQPKDPRAETWSGPRSGVGAARDVFNADESADVHDVGEVERRLGVVLKAASAVYTDLPLTKQSTPIDAQPWTTQDGGTADTRLGALVRGVFGSAAGSSGGRNKVRPLQPLANTLRSIKSPAEVAQLRLAGRLSGRAMTAAMGKEWHSEADLEAFLYHAFATNTETNSVPGSGAAHEPLSRAVGRLAGPAYVPVVAGGSHALCIHYVSNNALLSPSDLVVVDAGGESSGGYIADITRTWPVSGQFDGPQRDLYSAVLDAQKRAVKLVRESHNADATWSLDDVHNATEKLLVDNLVQIGFDRGALTTAPRAFGGVVGGVAAGISTLFPHHVGHHVGLDVHDCPGLSRALPLKPGMCVTVEPGIYVPEDDDRWPAAFRGVGVRVEDCVCVLPKEEVGENGGPLVLSVEAVKEVVDIEALRR